MTTKERLIAAVKELGATASTRKITRQAGANVAAVNYHFGSKDALLIAAGFPVTLTEAERTELEKAILP